MARKRRLRRKLLLLSIGAATVRYAYGRRRKPEAAAGQPDWAPLAVTPAKPPGQVPPEPTEAPFEAPWIAPVDGACPLTHPVKGNANSGIYHVPGGRFYDVTIPERCYRDPAAAEADGMRASKR